MAPKTKRTLVLGPRPKRKTIAIATDPTPPPATTSPPVSDRLNKICTAIHNAPPQIEDDRVVDARQQPLAAEKAMDERCAWNMNASSFEDGEGFVVKKMARKAVRKVVGLGGLVGCQIRELEKQNVVDSDGDFKSLVTTNGDSLVSDPIDVHHHCLSLGVSVLEAGKSGCCNAGEACEVDKEKEKEIGSVAQNVGVELNARDVVRMEVESSRNDEAALAVEDSVKVPNAGEGTVRLGSAAEVVAEEGNVDLVENVNVNGECAAGNVESGCAGNAGDFEDVGKPNQGRSQGEGEKGTGERTLSGEMEALERRRRRKTEIFIGGLEKEAKEEDVRKVFEEVGEVVEVRLLMKGGNTGRNKGYAFVRYASADDAEHALEKYGKVKVCGKECITSPVEGYDTLFIGNIDEKWKNEDVIKLLKEIEIQKLDKVTVMPDPTNLGCNRGFAFLEFSTCREAQNALKKLQNKDVVGKFHNIKASWAEPLNKPDEEKRPKIRSVYAESLPSSWDEEKIKFYFKKYGEIENVVLARSLHTAKRKDFAFINYTTFEAAAACVKSFNNETLSDQGSKVNVKVSLAKHTSTSRPTVRTSIPIHKKFTQQMPKAIQRGQYPTYPRNGVYISSNLGDDKSDRMSSTDAELLQLLRQQATRGDSERILGRGGVPSSDDHLYSLPERKRPYSALGSKPLYPDPRGYPRLGLESSYPVASPSTLCPGVGLTSRTYYDPAEPYTSGFEHTNYSNRFQRDGPHHESSKPPYYRHYRLT